MRLVAALAALALAGCEAADSIAADNQVEAEARDLAVLTSLPIFFSPEFSVEPVDSPLRRTLEEEWRLDLLPTSETEVLDGHELALLLHPPVQTAEALVDLDEWVRGGGRVLLLADPLYESETGLALGDPRAPPLFFMDTGLLAHWGVTLHGPEEIGNNRLGVTGRGRLEVEGEACEAADEPSTGLDGFIVHCRLGEGHALIIADADFLNRDPRHGYPGNGLLLAQLERLAAF
ncbi:GldG family protein [Sphingomicrobium flavum]|uniref:GldG family protein n=1 Tax=Sphingomicrobium flavum TaxID=1229164 RepID=UPI0021ADB111|nr:GldG family protein [Sphingomicrobium flavum]